MHRCLKIAAKPSREIRWLCFNSGKLFNCANYLIKTGSAKPNIYDLYNKLLLCRNDILNDENYKKPYFKK
jgi:hypothetical protein